MALIGILSTQLLHQQFVAGERLAAVAPLRPDRVVDAVTARDWAPRRCDPAAPEAR